MFETGWIERAKCSMCRQVKPLADFARDNKKNGHRSTCKSCHNPIRRLRQFRKYNLTEETYGSLFEKQNGKCACCGKSAKLVIDHSHITSKVRGLLCHPCNTGIGMLGDNLNGLQLAVEYLKTNG